MLVLLLPGCANCPGFLTACSSHTVANHACSPAYMLQSCKLSCGACSTAPTCVDDNSQCGYWASVGECAKK